MKLTWAEYERGGILNYSRLPALLRTQATTTRAEHLRSNYFYPDVAISVLCVMKINLPHTSCFVRSFCELFCLTEEV